MNSNSQLRILMRKTTTLRPQLLAGRGISPLPDVKPTTISPRKPWQRRNQIPNRLQVTGGPDHSVQPPNHHSTTDRPGLVTAPARDARSPPLVRAPVSCAAGLRHSSRPGPLTSQGDSLNSRAEVGRRPAAASVTRVRQRRTHQRQISQSQKVCNYKDNICNYKCF